MIAYSEITPRIVPQVRAFPFNDFIHICIHQYFVEKDSRMSKSLVNIFFLLKLLSI